MLFRILALVALGLLSTPLWAAECATTVEANDAMQYNVSTIKVPPSCKSFTVTLKHTGKLPASVMGHDWVMTTAADESGVVTDATEAGIGNNYLKPGDRRVIAATRIIGGGETTSVRFEPQALKPGTDYVFFCSYPGHAAVMHGTVVLGK